MRPDMPKVLVERPRPPSRAPRGRDGRRFRNASDAAFLPMKAGYRDLKSLNENLKPLARYLERQVNRPWNAVNREMRAAIDGRNAVQRHILEHVSQYVAVHTRLVDGAIVEVGAGVFGIGSLWQPLYVHPRTGLLLRNPHKISWRTQYRKRLRKADRERAAVWRELSPTRQLRRLNGSWFEVEIAPLPPSPETVWDVLRRCRVTRIERRIRHAMGDRDAEQLYGRAAVYAVSKRQLPSREIRRYRLDTVPVTA